MATSSNDDTDNEIRCQYCQSPAGFHYLDSILDPDTNEEYSAIVAICARHLILLEMRSK